VRHTVSFWIAVAISAAIVPRSVDAVPPACRFEYDRVSVDGSRHVRRLLRGLIPSIYVRWRGTGTGDLRRSADGTGTVGRSPDRSSRARLREVGWEVGLRWNPLEGVAALDEDREHPEKSDAPRVDPEICRRLSHLRTRVEETSDPDARTLLERAILERRLEAVRTHD